MTLFYIIIILYHLFMHQWKHRMKLKDPLYFTLQCIRKHCIVYENCPITDDVIKKSYRKSFFSNHYGYYIKKTFFPDIPLLEKNSTEHVKYIASKIHNKAHFPNSYINSQGEITTVDVENGLKFVYTAVLDSSSTTNEFDFFEKKKKKEKRNKRKRKQAIRLFTDR